MSADLLNQQIHCCPIDLLVHRTLGGSCPVGLHDHCTMTTRGVDVAVHTRASTHGIHSNIVCTWPVECALQLCVRSTHAVASPLEIAASRLQQRRRYTFQDNFCSRQGRVKQWLFYSYTIRKQWSIDYVLCVVVK